MPRFRNGTPGGNAAGFGMGQGLGAGPGLGRGRGANCRGNDPGCGLGAGLGAGTDRRGGFGQGQAAERDPGFFRRFCLGLADQGRPASNTRIGGFQSAIDDLQRQIDALKNRTDK